MNAQLQLNFEAAEERNPLVVRYKELLADLAPKRRWTALLRGLEMLPIEPPGGCSCTDPRDLGGWVHGSHALFNQAIRAAVDSAGARKGILQAAAFEEEVSDRSSSRRRALRDFLALHPMIEWFSAPVPQPGG